MAVMCAWASIGENGKITGGKPGDQTGREVKCGAIYDFGQTRVYRCKDRDKALAIGAAAHAMAINNMFGYNQSNRTTSFTELKKVKWPTKQEMLKYSIAVIVFIVIFGLYFYGLDAFFAWITSLVKGL